MTRLTALSDTLAQANTRLTEALALPHTPIHRDATIQRFEFTFELAWKAIQIFLREQGRECQSPKNCFRIAAEIELLPDPLPWFGFLEARNLIAHTYGEETAERVYTAAKDFPPAISALLLQMQKQG